MRRALRLAAPCALALLGCDAAPDRMRMPAAPEVDPAIADLGRLLFYDPVLSSDGETACATCHSEVWGMSDGLPTSIGVGGGRITGPGRKGGTPMTRNAPTLWNVALRESLFWDGRETSLERQVSAPLHSAIELDKPIDDVLAELRSIPEYVARFEAAFPGEPEALNEDDFRFAIASFERTLSSDASLWDAWMAGDRGALSDEMRAGWVRFGVLGCDACHAPPRFEREAYFSRGIGDDAGRGAITGRPEDARAWRVPTLRNVRESEPYFHDGSVETLEEAIAHEVELNTGTAATARDVEILTAFLGRGLVDRSREPDRPETVPSGLPVPQDGFRILRP